MEISFSSAVIKYFRDIKKKNQKLLKRIQQKLILFKENPRYPSLRTHKLEGKLSNSWSISIEGNIRMLYYIRKEEVVFFLVGTHDEVYKK